LLTCVCCACVCVSARVCVVRAFVLRNGSKLILGDFFFLTKDKILT